MVNKQFDPTDFKKPIRYYIEETYLSLNYGRSVMTNLFVKKSSITLNDDLMGLFRSSTEDYFFSRSLTEYQTGGVNDLAGEGVYFL